MRIAGVAYIGPAKGVMNKVTSPVISSHLAPEPPSRVCRKSVPWVCKPIGRFHSIGCKATCVRLKLRVGTDPSNSFCLELEKARSTAPINHWQVRGGNVLYTKREGLVLGGTPCRKLEVGLRPSPMKKLYTLAIA